MTAAVALNAMPSGRSFILAENIDIFSHEDCCKMPVRFRAVLVRIVAYSLAERRCVDFVLDCKGLQRVLFVYSEKRKKSSLFSICALNALATL